MEGLRSRLTYANVVATLALFLALSGSAVYAATKISGTTIKKKTLPGNRLKDESVTGTQVNEATLGAVPLAQSANLAKSADSAATAGDAQAVNGVSERVVRASLPLNGPFVPLEFDGLHIDLNCGTPATLASIGVTSPTNEDVGEFAATLSDGTTVQESFDGPVDPGVQTPTDGWAIGTASLRRPSGRLVRFDFSLRALTDGYGTTDDCFLSGFVRSAP